MRTFISKKFEIHGSGGYIATDHTGNTGIRAFTTESAGYVLEKAEADKNVTHDELRPVVTRMDELVASGAATSSELSVNTRTTGGQFDPSVAATPNGGFAPSTTTRCSSTTGAPRSSRFSTAARGQLPAEFVPSWRGVLDSTA